MWVGSCLHTCSNKFKGRQQNIVFISDPGSTLVFSLWAIAQYIIGIFQVRPETDLNPKSMLHCFNVREQEADISKF